MGIVIGLGIDVVMELVDIVLMCSDLMDVFIVVELSKVIIKNIKENFFWVFVYNILGILVVMGVLYLFGGFLLSLMIVVVVMSFSLVFVLLNVLCLKGFKFLMVKKISGS